MSDEEIRQIFLLLDENRRLRERLDQKTAGGGSNGEKWKPEEQRAGRQAGR